jgi:glycosyltransferase involved in cell wall biosynthesis
MSRRLLIVVNDAAFFLSHRLPIALAARVAGYDVHVATPVDENVGQIVRAGFAHHPLPLRRDSTNIFRELRAIGSLFLLYRHIKPEIVHHVALKAVLYGGVAARLARVPRVVHAITGLGHLFLSPRRSLLRRIVMALFGFVMSRERLRVIFQNPDDRELFVREGVVREKDCVLIRGSGVDIDEFVATAEPDGIPVVVLVSRMLTTKGVREFAEAARMVQQRGIQARFVLVGDIDAANPDTIGAGTLEAWQYGGALEWWGHRADIAEVFRKAHIVCLPSYREGLPKVLIEAASCARAIVATDVPGCREIVVHGRNGLLVPPRAVLPLAEAIIELLSEPSRRAAMGAAGRAMVVESFSVDRIVRQTLQVYEDLQT